MTTEERIEKLKPYFVSLQIDAQEGAVLLLIKFPVNSGWKLPKIEYTKEKYKTEYAQDQNGIYFATDISNGIDILFDCVEYIIEYNKTIQEKNELFNNKVEELKNIFSKEPLSRLYKLEFMFSDKGEGEEKEKNRRNKKCETDNIKNKKKDVKEVTEEVFVEKKNKASEDGDSTLMSLAKDLVGE